ncbi:MAG: hypothetical protein RBR71_00755 [Gudongella sp.]|nr:hypothetical protein [Gudongella sp.]
MAIIKDIRKVDKKIKPTSHTVMDYNSNEDYYSMWTYKSNDPNGEEGSKQTLQFDLKQVKVLLKTLEEFINSTDH